MITTAYAMIFPGQVHEVRQVHVTGVITGQVDGQVTGQVIIPSGTKSALSRHQVAPRHPARVAARVAARVNSRRHASRHRHPSCCQMSGDGQRIAGTSPRRSGLGMKQIDFHLLKIVSDGQAFHAPDLTPEKVAKVSKKPLEEARAGYEAILELRRLHIQLDTAVLTAYAWSDLPLGHDFVAVETLPENDRTHFTITPEARKELLKRLLAENHRRAEQEKNNVFNKPTTRSAKRKSAEDAQQFLEI